MRKRVIKINECAAGDKVALDVISNTGAVVVTEGTILNEFIINKLQTLGIKYIQVYSEENISASFNSAFEEMSKEYKKNVHAVKNIIGDLALGKKLNYGIISDIAEDIKVEMYHKDNVIKFLSTFKAYDEYTYNHSLNVAFYSMLLGKWIGLSEEVITELTKSAVMHDLGKAKIPDEILNKKGPLDKNEFEIMKKHAQYGYEIAKQDPRIGLEVLKGILMHHENEDGTGYPLRLKGDKINLFAKIISICDVYDALTQERVYKGRMTPFDAFKIIELDGYSKFDTKILLTFLHNIASYYIGMQVVLNDGRAGEIVYVTPKNVAYPIVKVEEEYIDLMSRKDLKIVSLLN